MSADTPAATRSALAFFSAIPNTPKVKPVPKTASVMICLIATERGVKSFFFSGDLLFRSKTLFVCSVRFIYRKDYKAKKT